MLCSGSFPEAFGVVPANVLLYQEYHWKTGECGFAPRSLVFYLWLLHRGLRGRSTRDKSKMKNHGAFLLLLLAFWNKRRYNRMEDDAWGKLISSSGSLAEINPLRYCGYYYDVETGFYYLQSWYCDPVVSRFINADSYASTGTGLLSYNMFAYCGNNPVNNSDPSGNAFLVAEGGIPGSVPIRPAGSNSNSIANHVTQTHVTREFLNLDAGILVGKVAVTATETYQDHDPKLFYSYTDTGVELGTYSSDFTVGIGATILESFGISAGVNPLERNIFLGTQLSRYIHVERSLGIDGLGLMIGVDIPMKESTNSFDLDITVGWGSAALAIALVFAPQFAPTLVPLIGSQS